MNFMMDLWNYYHYRRHNKYNRFTHARKKLNKKGGEKRLMNAVSIATILIILSVSLSLGFAMYYIVALLIVRFFPKNRNRISGGTSGKPKRMISTNRNGFDDEFIERALQKKNELFNPTVSEGLMNINALEKLTASMKHALETLAEKQQGGISGKQLKESIKGLLTCWELRQELKK